MNFCWVQPGLAWCPAPALHLLGCGQEPALSGNLSALCPRTGKSCSGNSFSHPAFSFPVLTGNSIVNNNSSDNNKE